MSARPQKAALSERLSTEPVFGQFQSAQFVTYTSLYPSAIDSEISPTRRVDLRKFSAFIGALIRAGASKLVRRQVSRVRSVRSLEVLAMTTASAKVRACPGD